MDTNSTGCENSGIPVQGLKVVTENGSESITTFTIGSGVYQLFPGEGDYTTTVSSTSLPDYYSLSPDSHFSNFTGIGFIDTADFCIETTQTINDLNIIFLPNGDARPGFEADYKIIYQNIGTTNLNDNIVLEFDETKMSFESSNVIPSSQTTNSITFEYINFNPFETNHIDLSFNIFGPPLVNIDDILAFTAIINPLEGDYTEEDNVFMLEQVVIGSYDPNDIIVLEGDELLHTEIDSYLHYIIRFQNTGTAHALKVEVSNILDEYLDWDTFEIEDVSHEYYIEIINGNDISFVFNGIYLPDSTSNEPESHGYIAYRIKPSIDIEIGDVISNNADIYFDFNPAIETNTVITEIVELSLVESSNPFRFAVFPIPVKNVLYIKSNTRIKHIEIYNNLGQSILSNSKQNKIDISILNSGLYFCKIISDNGRIGIKKIVKK